MAFVTKRVRAETRGEERTDCRSVLQNGTPADYTYLLQCIRYRTLVTGIVTSRGVHAGSAPLLGAEPASLFGEESFPEAEEGAVETVSLVDAPDPFVVGEQ